METRHREGPEKVPIEQPEACDSTSRDVPRGRGQRFLMLSAALWLAWVLFSQEVSPAALWTGAFFSLLVAAFSFELFFDYQKSPRFRKVFRPDLLCLYFLVVLIQSYLSSFDLIRRMLNRSYQPAVLRIRTRLRSPVGRVLLANTISMVPGTLTLWLDDDRMYVHWFDAKSRNSVAAGRLIKEQLETLLGKLFG